MERKLLLLCLCLLPFFSMAQEHQYSALYFNNGKLRADSSLSISAEQFKVWRRAEENIVGFINSHLSYPSVAARNGLEGRAVIAFEYKNKEIKNVRVVNATWEGFSEMATQAFQKSTPLILNEFNYWKRNFDFNLNGTYYLPIDFSLTVFREEMKKRNAIPVLKLSEPSIRVYGH